MNDYSHIVTFPDGVVWIINYDESGKEIERKVITDPIRKSVEERLAQLEKQNAILEASVNRYAQMQVKGAPETKHLECSECGVAVTSPVPQSTITTAYLLCPDCLEAIPDDIANQFLEQAKNRAKELKQEM